MKAILIHTSISLVALLYSCASGPSWPQPRPAEVVRWIVPGPSGGGVDVIARPIAQKLSESMSQPVMVENRAGASGLIAGQTVAAAPADGHTMLLGTSGTHAIMPALARKPPYDPVHDFAPVTMIATTPLLTAAHPSFPVRSIPELIKLAKARPRQVLYASNGTGSIHHLTIEMLSQAAGLSVIHVPYTGGPPAVSATIGGHVHVIMTAIPTAVAQVRAARLRALAVTGPTRSLALPDVPTISESGLRGFESVQWYSIFVPARTPAQIIDKLYVDVHRAAYSPGVTAALSREGADLAVNGPRALAEFHRADMDKWQKVIRQAHIALE